MPVYVRRRNGMTCVIAWLAADVEGNAVVDGCKKWRRSRRKKETGWR